MLNCFNSTVKLIFSYISYYTYTYLSYDMKSCRSYYTYTYGILETEISVYYDLQMYLSYYTFIAKRKRAASGSKSKRYVVELLTVFDVSMIFFLWMAFGT